MKKVKTKNKRISLLIGAVIPLTATVTMYSLYIATESIMEKLLIAAIFFFGIVPLAFSMIFPIINMLFFGTMKDMTGKSIPKKTIDQNGNIKIQQPKQKDFEDNSKDKKNYKKKENNNPNYLELNDRIKGYSKNGLLKRESILTFKNELDYKLGNNRYNYNQFSFENDMHEIYVKIKSSKLKDEDYLHLQKTLEDLIQ